MSFRVGLELLDGQAVFDDARLVRVEGLKLSARHLRDDTWRTWVRLCSLGLNLAYNLRRKMVFHHPKTKKALVDVQHPLVKQDFPWAPCISVGCSPLFIESCSNIELSGLFVDLPLELG